MKPSKVHLHKQSKTLQLTFAGQDHELSAEFLRVLSPSAEVQGHGPGQEKLVTEKIDVGIKELEPTGNYGIRIIFDDGHDSGIYSWAYLAELCRDKEQRWQDYLDKLKAENKKRDPHTQVMHFQP